MRLSGMLLSLSLVLLNTVATAQDSTITVTQLTDQLYLLSSDQGSYTTNTIAFVGDDGVLLVDTQSEADAAALKEVVDAFGKGPPKYIINSHRHVEHVGGNATFGDSPIRIAHRLVPTKLRSGSYIFDEFPDATFPDITLSDSLTLYFNGERIRIVAMPGSHDDNEIMVHFTTQKIVHLSSLVNGFTFPSVDSDGDVLRFPELVARAIALLPDDVVIVSGHNAPGTASDLHTYHDMLVQTTSVVRRGLATGKDLAALREEKVLDEWQHYAASYVSTDEWIEYLVDGLQASGEPQHTVFEPLYHVWKESGANAAVQHYFEMKRDQPDQYRFDEFSLLVIGMKLQGNGHLRAAITFYEASLRDAPDSDYGYYTNFKLATAHDELGDKTLATQYCEKALELNPEFAGAIQLLKRLKAE